MNIPQIPALVNASSFAELMGVSGALVSKWIKNGMPVARQRARVGDQVLIDIRQALPWAITYQEPAGSERERLARAQAIKVEMENARRRGELLVATHVAEVLNGMAADIAARLDGLPGRVAGEFAGMSAAEIRARLLHECRGIRSGFAEHVGKLANAPPHTADGQPDPEPTPGSKRKPVGKRKPRAAARQLRAGAVSK